MTPTETTTILRQFNKWRRDTSNWPPSPMLIEKAIDAAIAMIERLEAAEKERDEFKRACFGHISDNSMLRAEVKDRNEVIALLQNELRNYRERERTMGWNNG